jgi:hypothetical protein
MNSGKLKRHCKDVHGVKGRALREGETPVKPIWMNWKELTKNYYETRGILDLSARIINPTKKMLGKRLHSSDSDGDIPSKS